MPLDVKDEVIVKVAGQKVGGWAHAEIRVGVEIMPSEFTLVSTPDRLTGSDGVPFRPGDACEVWLGGDKVLTGYIARDYRALAPARIEIIGQGKCCDLVQCSAELPGGQISGVDVRAVAAQLCQPYGIKVVGDAGENPLKAQVDATGKVTGFGEEIIPRTNLIFGETPVEVLERLCRFRGLLYYETADGDLRLARIGTALAAGGLKEGVNVLNAERLLAMDQRYSEVVAVRNNVDTMQDAGGTNSIGLALDSAVPRHRRLYIVAESSDGSGEVVRKRAVWEVNRRAGRADQVTVPVDSWRDAAGTLWTPNTMCPVHLPSLGLTDTYAIAAVTFRQDEKAGTTAELFLMPRFAFSIEPIVYQPIFADLQGPAAAN